MVLLPLASMLRLTRRYGCRVEGVQRWQSDVPGREGVGYVVRCPSHAAKVALLDGLAWWDARHDLALRAFALDVRKVFGSEPAALAWAIQRLVQEEIAFLREPRETFQDSYLTLYYGAGDCDDHARLVAALARILSLPARLRTLRDRASGAPKHVAAQVGVDGRWWWLETTVAAQFGEHPVTAKKRLNAKDREDL